MQIAIIGYGKMGKLIAEVAIARGHSVGCIIEKQSNEFNNADSLNSLFGHFDDDKFLQCDVAFEFTTPSSAQNNILECWKHCIPVICGTTGWDDTYLRKLDDERVKKGEKSLLVHKSNFSVGVNLLREMSSLLSKKMDDIGRYKPSITEIHHIHKIDKPSGTALLLAATINNKNVPISSIRRNEEVGTHTVRWESDEDIIEITHIAKNRKGFAIGAILEAEKLLEVWKS